MACITLYKIIQSSSVRDAAPLRLNAADTAHRRWLPGSYWIVVLSFKSSKQSNRHTWKRVCKDGPVTEQTNLSDLNREVIREETYSS